MIPSAGGSRSRAAAGRGARAASAPASPAPSPPSARGSTCRAAPVRQRNGKLRLRSTPRAFWRVPARGRPGCRCGRARTRRRPRARARSRATIASPAGSLPCTSPTTSTFTGAPASPTRVARISRPCDRVADDERRERGGDEHPRVVASLRDGAGRDRGCGDVRRVAGVVARRARRRGRAGRPVRARRCAGDIGRRDAADPLLARRGRRLRGDGAAGADAVARAGGRVRRGPAERVRRELVRAPRGRLGGRVRARAQARSASRPSASRSSRPRRASRPSTATTSRGCCTSPRPACCARSRRCRRSRAARSARGAELSAAAPAGRRRGRARRRRRSRATASSGAAAAGSRSSSPSSSAARHPPGAVLLRRRAGLARRARLGRLRPRDLRHRRPRRARREGRVGPGGPAAGPRRRAPAGDRRDRAARPAATPPTASRRSRRRRWRARSAAATSSRPTRTSSPRRTPSTRAVWIVGGGSGHGFKHGPAMAERIADAWDGGEPLPPRFALGERSAASRCAAPARTSDGHEPGPVVEHRSPPPISFASSVAGEPTFVDASGASRRRVCVPATSSATPSEPQRGVDHDQLRRQRQRQELLTLRDVQMPVEVGR